MPASMLDEKLSIEDRGSKWRNLTQSSHSFKP